MTGGLYFMLYILYILYNNLPLVNSLDAWVIPCLKAKELGDEKRPSHLTRCTGYYFAVYSSFSSSACVTYPLKNGLLKATKSSSVIPHHLRLSPPWSQIFCGCLHQPCTLFPSTMRAFSSVFRSFTTKHTLGFSWDCFFEMFHNQVVHLAHESRHNLDATVFVVSLPASMSRIHCSGFGAKCVFPPFPLYLNLCSLSGSSALPCEEPFWGKEPGDFIFMFLMPSTEQ